MRLGRRIAILSRVGFLAAAAFACAQEVVDRIVARVDNDIILLSDMRELARYQNFVDDKSESDSQKSSIAWSTNGLCAAKRRRRCSRGQPSDEEVVRSLARLKRLFSSPEEYEERRKQAGLTEAALIRMPDHRCT